MNMNPWSAILSINIDQRIALCLTIFPLILMHYSLSLNFMLRDPVLKCPHEIVFAQKRRATRFTNLCVFFYCLVICVYCNCPYDSIKSEKCVAFMCYFNVASKDYIYARIKTFIFREYLTIVIGNWWRYGNVIRRVTKCLRRIIAREIDTSKFPRITLGSLRLHVPCNLH